MENSKENEMLDVNTKKQKRKDVGKNAPYNNCIKSIIEEK